MDPELWMGKLLLFCNRLVCSRLFTLGRRGLPCRHPLPIMPALSLLCLLPALAVAEEFIHIHFDSPPPLPAAPFPPRLRFHFTAFNVTFSVDAWRNDELFSGGYTETVEADDTRVQRTLPHEAANAPHRHCHYVGRIDGDDRAKVAFSTCRGGIDGRLWAYGHDLLIKWRGAMDELVIDDIAPNRRRRLQHARHSARPFAEAWQEAVFSCGVHDDHGHGDHFHGTSEQHEAVRAHLAVHPLEGRRLAVGATQKYVEVLAVNDYTRYVSFGGNSGAVTTMAASTAAIMNVVTTIYRNPTGTDTTWTNINVQVVLVGQHSFTSADPWEGTVMSTANSATIANGNVDSSSLLDKFNTWVDQSAEAGAVVAHDNHVLISGRDFEGSTVGLAGVSTMCGGARSGNVNMQMGSSSANVVAAVVAHEMGHNFGSACSNRRLALG